MGSSNMHQLVVRGLVGSLAAWTWCWYCAVLVADAKMLRPYQGGKLPVVAEAGGALGGAD